MLLPHQDLRVRHLHLVALLVAPGQAKLGRPAVPTQAYTYDLTPPRENEAAEGAADAPADLVQQQEDDLLRALRESVGEEGA